jgi:hypothetical protein
LCGPDDAAGLFGEGAGGGDTRAIRTLAQGFEGAWPYLELIARANGIPDPLDARVVDAYWLGSPLLERVTADMLADSMRTRFKPRMDEPVWRWLRATAPAGAKPVHAFHVFDVFPKAGLLRGGQADNVLQIMDSCRVRWARVLERCGDQLVVEASALELRDAKLRLGPPRVERIAGWRDGAGFIGDVVPGDVVAVHWDWACDVLTPRQVSRLTAWTRRALAIANQSM